MTSVKSPLHEQMVSRFDYIMNVYNGAYRNAVPSAFPITVGTYIKAWLGIIYLFQLHWLRSRKYVFENFRSIELIDCLNSKEVLILGGEQDRSQCSRMGFGLLRTGGIFAAILIAWKHGRTSPLRLQIYLARKLLRGNKKYYFLWEDTLPVGIFFSLIGNSLKHSTVCIQHGFYPEATQLVDGALCQYNLLLALEQSRFIESDNSKFFELGLPYDATCSNAISREVVLVGTGAHIHRRDFYLESLKTFKRIEECLSRRGWSVTYRPHPGEYRTDYAPLFSVVDEGSKIACLSGSQKVFIGYVSTLLYEAKESGHCVLSVNSSSMLKNSFALHGTIDLESLDDVGQQVEHLFSEMTSTKVQRLPSIRDRFLAIVSEIEFGH